MIPLIRTLFFLITLLVRIPNPTWTEVRFCHKGPHKVSDRTCPGGIYFKSPISTTCFFFTKDSDYGALIEPGFVGGVCEDLQSLPADTDIFQTKDVDIQFINITVDPTDTGSNQPGGSLSNGECISECFEEWEPTSGGQVTPKPPIIQGPGPKIHIDIPDTEEPENDDRTPPITPNITIEQQDVSEGLFTFLLDGQDHAPKGTPEMRVIQLFEQSIGIFQLYCPPPYVSNNFMQTILAAMKWLVIESQTTTPFDVGKREFNVIRDTLELCNGTHPPGFILDGPECAGKAPITSLTYKPLEGENITVGYTKRGKSFRWGKYDPIIEAAWAIITFVHGHCLPHFVPNFNHLHLYVDGMEVLFPPHVVQRWIYPHKLKKGDGFLNIVTGTTDLKTEMRNIDFCAQAAYYNSPFKERLDRPFYVPLFDNSTSDPSVADANTRSKANDDDATAADSSKNGSPSGGGGGDETTPSPNGWTGTPEEYWKQYEAKGGFKAATRDFAYCASSREDGEKYFKGLHDAAGCTN